MKLKLNIPTGNRIMITALFVALFAMTAISLAVADSVTKKRRFEGRAVLGVCHPKPGGGWERWDELVIPNLTFDLSVRDVINEKEFTTNSTWEGVTKRGRRVRVRLVRAGKAKFNPATGDLSVELAFEIETGGKRFSTVYTASTDHIVSVDGSLKGDSAQANLSERSLSFALAGEKEVKVARELVEIESASLNKSKTGSQAGLEGKPKSVASPSATENILIFGHVKGKAIAID